ncbi:hypothetical protein RUND412_007781 [Rhizina undulata]
MSGSSTPDRDSKSTPVSSHGEVPFPSELGLDQPPPKLGSRATTFNSMNFGSERERTPEQKEEYLLTHIPGAPLVHEDTVKKYLEKDLFVRKLNKIHTHLWWAGSPHNIRPLHKQKMMHREILITEDPTLHLIWDDRSIYIKPLPTYVLHFNFFKRHIAPNEELRKCANGLLYTYTRMILYHSDFVIAKENTLIPRELEWDEWIALSRELRALDPQCKDLKITKKKEIDINDRYIFGELRLGRLNQIKMFIYCERSYYLNYQQYEHFFSKKFAWVVLFFAFISVVLAAMQVIIGLPESNPLVQRSSYWFGIASIIAVVSIIGVGLLMFVVLFTWNCCIALVKSRPARNRQWSPRVNSMV